MKDTILFSNIVEWPFWRCFLGLGCSWLYFWNYYKRTWYGYGNQKPRSKMSILYGMPRSRCLVNIEYVTATTSCAQSAVSCTARLLCASWFVTFLIITADIIVDGSWVVSTRKNRKINNIRQIPFSIYFEHIEISL